MTRQTAARLVLAVVFAGLLATPYLMRRFGPRAAPAAPAAGVDARAQYGFRLTESAKAAGLDFVHEAPTLDAKLAHIMPQVASMGAAVSVGDFDADGHPDLYVTNSREGSREPAVRNRGDGTFEDVAERLDVADLNQSRDRRVDGLGVGRLRQRRLRRPAALSLGPRRSCFTTTAARGFTRVTDAANLPRWANINTAVWLDYDRDGLIDIFMGGYYPETVNLWKLADTKMMPESFEYANNGGRKYLYRNLGGGRFEEVSERVGLVSRRWALAAVAADLRGTRLSRSVHRERLRRLGAVHQRRRTLPRSGPRERRRLCAEERDERVGRRRAESGSLRDLRVEHLRRGDSDPGQQPVGADGAQDARSARAALRESSRRAMGVDLGGWSFGAQFGDLNNDGFLDLYLVNGYVSASREENYWYDYSKVAGGHEVVISDAKNWPAMGTRSLAGYQQKKVWINDGAGRFIDVAPMVGASDRYDGRAVALADLTGRGALDVIVANQRGPLLLYQNDVAPGRDWIAFDLAGLVRAAASSDGPRTQVHRIAARSARASPCTGAASSRRRKCPAGRASARRISAACTSASARAPPFRRSWSAGRRVRSRSGRTSPPTTSTR